LRQKEILHGLLFLVEQCCDMICFQELPISSRNEWSDGFGSYCGTLHVWFRIHVALDLKLKGKFEMNISLLTLYSLQISHELESFRRIAIGKKQVSGHCSAHTFAEYDHGQCSSVSEMAHTLHPDSQ
jgi:hypothetical protein